MLVIEMNDGKVMKFELDPENAPITCANMEKLANEGFYDGLIFHRIIKDFMIQGGDPEGTGIGGSDEEIKGEFIGNGVVNNCFTDKNEAYALLDYAYSHDLVPRVFMESNYYITSTPNLLTFVKPVVKLNFLVCY